MSSSSHQSGVESQTELVQRLGGLQPLPAPPPALWQRIDQSLARRRRARRVAAALGLAAALAAVAVLPNTWQRAAPPAPPALADSAPASDFEQEALAALRRELWSIDRQLEAAYRGSLERDQIPRLWLLRQRIEQLLEDPNHAESQLIHL